jgi:hypothetical protein
VDVDVKHKSRIGLIHVVADYWSLQRWIRHVDVFKYRCLLELRWESIRSCLAMRRGFAACVGMRVLAMH